MKKNNYQKSAFTLIEIIVVLFIVSMALLGILSLISQSIRAQNYNKKSIVANQLSQEGVELIRRIRDNNFINSNPFNSNLVEITGEENTYIIDYDDNFVTELISADDSVLQINDDGFFVHDNIYSDSGFSRDIEIELVNDHVLRVVSSVYFKSYSVDKKYQVEALLYDWF